MGRKAEGRELPLVKQAEWITVRRSEIHSPDYNPRKIDKQAAEKLRKQIREDGLVDTLVVNRRTMNIVGGNQRTAQLDRIYKYVPNQSDYELNVQMVDLDERAEIRLNARLNNPDAAGTYDAEKLIQLIDDFDLDIGKDLNFDRLTYDYLLSESGLDVESLAPENAAAMRRIEREIRDVRPPAADRTSEEIEAEKQAARQRRKTDIAERERRDAEGTSNYIEKDDYVLTIVFNTNQEKQEFCRKMGLASSENFIKGSLIREVIKPGVLD